MSDGKNLFMCGSRLAMDRSRVGVMEDYGNDRMFWPHGPRDANGLLRQENARSLAELEELRDESVLGNGTDLIPFSSHMMTWNAGNTSSRSSRSLPTAKAS